MLAALFTVLVFCVRLVVLLMTIPLFAMAALTGLVDGLVRRHLRKFGTGRESSYLYHKARATIMPLAIFLDLLLGTPDQHQSHGDAATFRCLARRVREHYGG